MNVYSSGLGVYKLGGADPLRGPSAQVRENRERLRAALGMPQKDLGRVQAERRDRLYDAIRRALEDSPLHIDLRGHKRSLPDMHPDVVRALVAVLGEPGAHITLPALLRRLPAWTFRCSRVSIQIPFFAGEQLDFSDWAVDLDGHRPKVNLTADLKAYPRVMVPAHLDFTPGERVHVVEDLVELSDRQAHEALLAQCVDPQLLEDPRILDVKPFVAQKYIKRHDDPNSPLVTIELNEWAVPLIIDYYEERFNTQIALLRSPDGEVLELEDEGSFDLVQSAVNQTRACNPGEDYRQAFIARVNDQHWAPLVYLREGGPEGPREALFYADALGSLFSSVAVRLSALDLPILAIAVKRQKDWASCVTDALVYCRIMTMPLASGEYELTGLLNTIFSNTTFVDTERGKGYHIVTQLPEALLMTAQRSEFVETYPLPVVSSVVHITTAPLGKNHPIPESIDLFRFRHTEEDVPTSVGRKDVAHYARFKGFNFARTVRMQHARRQLKEVFKDEWTEERDENYVAKAKEHIGYMDELEIDRSWTPDPMDEESEESQSSESSE